MSDKMRPSGGNRGTPTNDGDVRAVLERAGRRKPLPSEDLAQIRGAAQEAWRDLVQDERRRQFWIGRVLPLAAGLLLVAALGLWWGSRGDRADTVATVELVTGRVDMSAGAQPPRGRAPRVGARLRAGLWLETAASRDAQASHVALRLSGGQALRVDSGTRIHLLSPTRVELVRGAVYVDSRAELGAGSAAAEPVAIGTGLGVVRDIGTQYEVRFEDDEHPILRVRVRNGTVAVEGPAGSFFAGGGEELTVRSDGSVSQAATEPYGEAWTWVLNAVPPIDIEDLPLSSFLDWVSRETGWRIRYADPALEHSARTIRLHGTIEGLRPDEATEVILEGSGLSHRLRGGVLFVDAP